MTTFKKNTTPKPADKSVLVNHLAACILRELSLNSPAGEENHGYTLASLVKNYSIDDLKAGLAELKNGNMVVFE